MFFGTYSHSLDDKGRLRLPAKLKATLGEREAYLSKGADGCIYILPKAYLESVFEKLKSVSITSNEYMAAVRKFSSSVQQIDEDSQGRFVLPQFLKTYGDIEKRVIFTGIGDRIELWGEEKWKQYDESCGSFDEEFSKLAQKDI